MKKALPIVFFFFVNFSIFGSTNILFLGDSLSEGQGVNENQAFPRLVENYLRIKKFDVKVTNGGVSGSTTASGDSRLKWHLKQKIDIIVLELGANDGLRGLKISETEKNLTSIVKIAKNKKIKVLLLGLLMPPNYGKKYSQEFQQMYKRISSVENIPLMPFVLTGVAGVVENNQADGIHPNVKGHEIIAKNVSDFLEKNL